MMRVGSLTHSKYGIYIVKIRRHRIIHAAVDMYGRDNNTKLVCLSVPRLTLAITGT
jgi:hypothetical protein